MRPLEAVMRDQALDFLKRVVSTPSPSGFEQPVAELYREYVTPYADKITTDIMGNCPGSAPMAQN